MSAIFGIINKKGNPIEPASIQAMQAALKHRAVDVSGIYHCNNVLLGHQKFITNIYQTNEQLPYEEGDYVITSDARIDNRRELLDLLRLGKKISEIHDGMLILEAYKKWGEKCTVYLEGEFAFVIWNKQTQVLFAATDHIGFRPFYYYDTPDTFVFATEIKGILSVKQKPVLFNEAIIAEYFTKKHSDGTFDKEISALLAANYLLLEPNKPLFRKKYWEIKALGKYRYTRDEDWVECLRELLTKSVQNRLYTEGTVGVTLSGGLDSSFVAAITAGILEKQNKPLYAFSSVLPEEHKGPEKDERFYITALGKQYPNIEQTFVYPPVETGPFTNLADVFEKTERLVYPFHYMDQALCAAAKQKKVTILMNGFGGDMNISNRGRDVIYELLKSGEIKKVIHYFKWKRMEKSLWNNDERPLSFLRFFKSEILDNTLFFKHIYNPGRVYSRQGIPFSGKFLFKILANGYAGDHPHNSYFQQRINSGSLGVTFNTVASFSPFYQMETNMPILDKSINEFYFDLPPEQLILNGQQRSLMRRAITGFVPAAIVNRTDKKPYSPDFFSRLVMQKDYIAAIVKNSEIFNAQAYLNKQLFRKQVSALLQESSPGLGVVDRLLIAQSIIIHDFLVWLANKS